MHIVFYLQQRITDNNVLEVLNVYVNENNVKKLIFLEGFFFPSSEKLTFEIENVILFNTFFNLNLFFSIVVNCL